MLQSGVSPSQIPGYSVQFFDYLEAMVSDGWVNARTQPGAEPVPELTLNRTDLVHANRDAAETSSE